MNGIMGVVSFDGRERGMEDALGALEWNQGIHLVGSVLWFDAARHDVLSFVSSARVRDAWRHTRALCTERTRALLRVSRPAFQALVMPFGRRVALGPLELTLLPAGFMPGSAQVVVEGDHGRVLYANNVCLESHNLAETLQIAQADTLILKTAYGRPGFSFPARADARAMIVEAAHRVLGDNAVPVFLCSPIGKAQEVVRTLTDAGVPVVVHPSVARVNRVYRTLGFDPGPTRIFKGSPRRDSALVFPEALRTSPSIRRLKKARLFWVSGLAQAPDALARMHVEEGIPLAGHLDFAGLMRFVDLTAPRRVFTVGTWAEEFAAALRKKGFEASALYRESQLSLF